MKGIAQLSAAAHRHLMKLQHDVNDVAVAAAEAVPSLTSGGGKPNPSAVQTFRCASITCNPCVVEAYERVMSPYQLCARPFSHIL